MAEDEEIREQQEGRQYEESEEQGPTRGRAQDTPSRSDERTSAGNERRRSERESNR